MSGAWPAFWHLLTWVCVAWYCLLTLHVTWRGFLDIRGMLGRLKERASPGGSDEERTP